MSTPIRRSSRLQRLSLSRGEENHEAPVIITKNKSVRKPKKVLTNVVNTISEVSSELKTLPLKIKFEKDTSECVFKELEPANQEPVEEKSNGEGLSEKDMKIEELMKQLEELTETNKKLQAQVEKLEDEKRILSEANIVLQGLGLFFGEASHQSWMPGPYQKRPGQDRFGLVR